MKNTSGVQAVRKFKEEINMNNLPKIALGAWAVAKGTLPIIGVTKVSHVEDAVKAANITLTADEVKELESVADSLSLNVIRFWEKEMK